MLRTLKTGHSVEPMNDEEFNRIKKDFPNYDGLVRMHPGGWVGFSSLPDQLDRIYDFDFKPSDVMVITYPKSGTTWMQEIVWTLIHNPNLDNPDAKLSADIRSPHIELDAILKPSKVPKLNKDSKLVQLLAKTAPHKANDPNVVTAFLEEGVKSPRVIKSHLPLPLFPPKMLENSKVVYLARDARDVIVSKFHFFSAIMVHNYQGTLEEFVEYMINEEQINHPYWPHVKAAYDLKDHPNLLFLYFEDLKTDPKNTITAISEFLNLDRTPEQIMNVVNYTNFKTMKNRSETGETDQPMSDGGRYYNKEKEGFFRHGKSGNWKDSFSQNQVKKISQWMDKNMEMFPSDFKYKEKK